MKKNAKYSSNPRLQLRFRNEVVFSGTGAIATGYPVRKPNRRKYTPRPHLEKIGGMDKAVRDFINRFCELSASTTSILRTSVKESIEQIPSASQTIINLKRLNDVKEINAFLYRVNKHLPEEGKFIGCVETKYKRKERILKKFPKGFNSIFYIIDFFYKRVAPKFKVTRPLYLLLSGDRNKVLSRTETMGRLYAAGFEITENKFIGNNWYFVAVKKKSPLFSNERSYGPIFRMRRHGKNGKIIHVYKMRTMHAYSEFIQQYVYENNNLDEGGKLKNDFRVSTLGKFFRKYWIDELPMIYNLLKGDIKIVGVRPLSSHYLSLYSDELKHKRLLHKPGLIPPFYVDLPKTLEDIQSSEMRYLRSYERNPFVTDIVYFFKALYNIIIKKARSK